MKDLSIIRLLNALRAVHKKEVILRKAGIEPDGFTGEFLSLIPHIILDELGFPPENTRGVRPSSRKYYCRDWIMDKIFGFERGRRPVDQFLAWLKKTAIHYQRRL